jgi:hypothetical protein
MRTAQERGQGLEEDLRRAGEEEEERLRQEPRDTNGAYQDGPGAITLDGTGADGDGGGAARAALDPRRRILLGAAGLALIIVIIIVAFGR